MTKLIWHELLNGHDKHFKNMVTTIRQDSEKIAENSLISEERGISELRFGIATSSNNVLKIGMENSETGLLSRKAGSILYGVNTSNDSEDRLKSYCAVTFCDRSTCEILPDKDGAGNRFSVYFNGGFIGSVDAKGNKYDIQNEHGPLGTCYVDQWLIVLNDGTTIDLSRFSLRRLIKRGILSLHSRVLSLTGNNKSISLINDDVILPKTCVGGDDDILLFAFSTLFRCKFFQDSLLPD